MFNFDFGDGFVAPMEERLKKVPTSRLKDGDPSVSIFGIPVHKGAGSDESSDENEFSHLMKRHVIGTDILPD